MARGTQSTKGKLVMRYYIRVCYDDENIHTYKVKGYTAKGAILNLMRKIERSTDIVSMRIVNKVIHCKVRRREAIKQNILAKEQEKAERADYMLSYTLNDDQT